MARKKRTDQSAVGENSNPQAGGITGRGGSGQPTPLLAVGGTGGRGGGGQPMHPQQSASGGRGGGQPPLHAGGGGGGGRLMSPQQAVCGQPGSGRLLFAQGPQGDCGNDQLGGMVPQQYGGPPSELQGRSGGCPQGHGGGPMGGPFLPAVPEQHQASQAPFQLGRMPSQAMTVPPPWAKASSPAPPVQADHSQVQQQMQQLSVQEGPSQDIQPLPSCFKEVRFPLRPGKGSTGFPYTVKANHFLAQLLPNKDLYLYKVSIISPLTSRVSPGVNRAVMRQWLINHKGYLKRLPVYDGRKCLYTAGPLPFKNMSFMVFLDDDRNKFFFVAIHLIARMEGAFLQGHKEALEVLAIVLRQLAITRFSPVGRSFYSPDFQPRVRLGDGLESWRGFYQSLRPTQMGFSLNIDMSSTAFIEPLPVMDFVTQLLGRDVTFEPLSDSDRVKIKKALRGVKVEVTHRENLSGIYRISGLTSQATWELTFPVDKNGTLKSVVQYFYETYGVDIQRKLWPCLQVGNQERPNYLPMEVCKIVQGQRYSQGLNDRQRYTLLCVSSQCPQEKKRDIEQTVRRNAYDADPYVQEFGIKISEELASVEARVLPPPWLKYHPAGRDTNVRPKFGEWNMMNKKMFNGGKVTNWICINFSRDLSDDIAKCFCYELAATCQISGMVFNPVPVLEVLSAPPDKVEETLTTRCCEAKTKLLGRELDLLLVILPDINGSLYGDIKRICETELGIVSQCCLSKHVSKINKQYLTNVSLKINVKVGGRNTVLADALMRRIRGLSDRPTIIFGADVTHPDPGDDSSPSIAAVVASKDWPEVTKYTGLVCAQAHRQELIQDLYTTSQNSDGKQVSGGMLVEHLRSFYRSTGLKPHRIIFYRDGVSEGQLYQVLLNELGAIWKACAEVEEYYKPPVTFVVVQKRHHTNLFPDNGGDRKSVDKTGNILPGTVVDSQICHPTEFDFYLCSHASIQGTSRPTHYHVLWDENKFTADELQSLTNNLCYTYARCTRSVSIVPPVYYAHLAAFRARFYMKRETSDSGSMMSDAVSDLGGLSATMAPPKAAVHPLPALKENVKKVMFYC